MPADKLGGRMGDDVRTPFKRTAQVWCGEGTIYHQRDTEFFPDFGNRFQWEHIDARIPEGFTVQDLGVGLDGFAEVLRIRWIDEGHIDSQAREGVGELVVGAAVQGCSRDDVIACLTQGEDRQGLGGMPGAGGQGSHPAFQVGDALFEHITGRVHDTGVDIPALLQREQFCSVFGAVEEIRSSVPPRVQRSEPK